MTTESALTFIQIGSEIRAKQLFEDMDYLLFPPRPPFISDCSKHMIYGTPLLQPVIEWLAAHKARTHGHGLGSIRRFKGL